MNDQDNQVSDNQQQGSTTDLPVNEERAVEVKGGVAPVKDIRFKPGKG